MPVAELITTPTRRLEGQNRRDRCRMAVDMKVFVQAKTTARSEIATIKNMCRTGFFFEGFGDYYQGMPVMVTYPYDPTNPSSTRPQWAEVVRVQTITGSIKHGVAVKLLNLFMKA